MYIKTDEAIEAIEQAGGSVEFIDKLEFYRRSFNEAGIDFPETSEKISKVGTEYPKLNSIMSVYSTVVEYNDAGDPVLRRNPENNRFVGVDFIWSRVLTMSPYHGAFGGVARANLMMYGLQATHESGANSVRYQPISQGEIGIQEMYERQKKRRAWRKAVKLLIRLFRDSMYTEEKNRIT